VKFTFLSQHERHVTHVYLKYGVAHTNVTCTAVGAWQGICGTRHCGWAAA